MIIEYLPVPLATDWQPSVPKKSATRAKAAYDSLIMSIRAFLRPSMVFAFFLASFVLLTSVAQGSSARKERKAREAARQEAIENLPEKYRAWYKGVEVIISEDETDVFVALEKDYQRDAFIERFWKVRDPIKRTARNEYREEYNARAELARQFGWDARARALLLNGPPAQRHELDCTPSYWPLEVWFYAGSEMTGAEFILIFYQIGSGGFRLWDPFEEVKQLQNMGRVTGQNPQEACRKLEDGDILRAAIVYVVNSQGSVMGASLFQKKVTSPPDPPQKEWVATFSTYSTELPEGAETFEARTEIEYPGYHQSRTVLQGAVVVDLDKVVLGKLGPATSYNLMLNGEVLRRDDTATSDTATSDTALDKLFENFRYKYDFPEDDLEASVPLVFQRYLRPGEYRLVLKVEDLNSRRFYRYDEMITVPKVGEIPPPKPRDPETARILAEANAAISTGENTIKIIPPMGDWQTGLARVDTLTTGADIAKVSFMVDGRPVLTKTTPPFQVELDFGKTPRSLILRVEAHSAIGDMVANDELLLNAGQHRFEVRLVEPRPGKTYTSSLRAQADVLVPEGEIVERVEFYLNETLVSSVYQPPYIQPIVLPDGEAIAYLRAVAYTPEGTSTEHVVFINAPDYLENVDVDFVELYALVLDKKKHPVDGLTRESFTILEDGVAQEVVRFEQVRDLSIHAAVMLDVSASMDEELVDAQAAALSFFEQAITTKDRASIITFNDHPNLVTKFTNNYETLAGGLAGLRAERGTSLYDSLIFALYYFNGIKGQRAILLLSDGKDESSRYKWDDALDYSRRAGVAIYTIGLKLKGRQADAKKKLSALAEETGGRSFFIEDTSELKAIYETIQLELRSRYLLAYQSNNTSGGKDFRIIEVDLGGGGLEAKTLRGYYP